MSDNISLDIRIRKCTLPEAEKLRELAVETFRDTYARFNTLENMESYVLEHFNAGRIREELGHPDTSFYFAENREHGVVGYIKFSLNSKLPVEPFDEGLEIQRVYVLAPYKGLKIGRKLLDKAVETAKNEGMNCIWLGVWENNPAAIGFYTRSGFRNAGSITFVLGTEVQHDYCMVLDLTPRSSQRERSRL